MHDRTINKLSFFGIMLGYVLCYCAISFFFRESYKNLSRLIQSLRITLLSNSWNSR